MGGGGEITAATQWQTFLRLWDLHSGVVRSASVLPLVSCEPSAEGKVQKRNIFFLWCQRASWLLEAFFRLKQELFLSPHVWKSPVSCCNNVRNEGEGNHSIPSLLTQQKPKTEPSAIYRVQCIMFVSLVFSGCTVKLKCSCVSLCVWAGGRKWTKEKWTCLP